jgi:hypothetical protein
MAIAVATKAGAMRRRLKKDRFVIGATLPQAMDARKQQTPARPPSS